MKKKHIILLVVAVILAVLMIVYIQIIMHKNDNVEYHWEPLIYTGIAVGAIAIGSLLILGVMVLVNISKVKRLTTAYANRQFDTVIQLRNCNRLLKKGSKGKDSVNYAVATAYLETGNNEMFLEYINNISCADLTNLKSFWMAIYSILIEDYEHFSYWQEQLQNSTNENNKDGSLKMLDSLYRHKKESYVLNEEEKENVLKMKSNVLNSLFGL